MRTFAYNEQGLEFPVLVTEDEIRRTYWPYWCGEMTKRGKTDMITWANCLDDWLVVNWAWEITSASPAPAPAVD